MKIRSYAQKVDRVIHQNTRNLDYKIIPNL